LNSTKLLMLSLLMFRLSRSETAPARCIAQQMQFSTAERAVTKSEQNSLFPIASRLQ
jgi:hypothetical protein